MGDWQELTKLVGDEALTVQRVHLTGRNITIEGDFELPPLAMLTAEDQIFIAVFVRSHGSIKQMEQAFGISYPTVKNRLNRISGELSFADTVPIPEMPEKSEVLEQLERGEITAREAIERLKE